jgi:hypothetical protein
MFGLKLPSELKKGAAEEEHSIKKARGELLVPLDPEAGLVWKKNKGGPVWGVKGQPDGPPEPKKEISIKLKPAWSTQPAPAVHSIAGDLAKPKTDQSAAQNPPTVRARGWAIPQPLEQKKSEREPVFQGNAWADEVEADENLHTESSAVPPRVEDDSARTQKPTVREGGRYSGFIREEVEDRAVREAREAEARHERDRESDREGSSDHAHGWQQNSQDGRVSDRAQAPLSHSSDRWAERSSTQFERGGRGSESPRGLSDGAQLSRERENGGFRNFAPPSFDRGQSYQGRERWDDALRGGRPISSSHGYAYPNRAYDGTSPRDARPNWRGEGSGDRYSGPNVGRQGERYDDARRDDGMQRLGYSGGNRESDGQPRAFGGDMTVGRPGAYRPPSAIVQHRQQISRPNFGDTDPTNPNPTDTRGSEGILDTENRRPRSTSLTEDPR